MNGNGDWEAVVYAPGEGITVMQTSIERTMEPYHDSDASNNNVADNRSRDVASAAALLTGCLPPDMHGMTPTQIAMTMLAAAQIAGSTKETCI